MKFPTEVPILGPRHFVRGAMGNHKGQHCINGWIGEAFLANDNMSVDQVGLQAPQVVKAMLWASRKLGLKVSKTGDVNLNVRRAWQLVDVNDEKVCGNDACTWKNVNSASILARVWNLGIARLGYVVDNPETKTLRRILRVA